MGQLIVQGDWQTRGRMMEVAMVMKKVELHISREELAAFGRILSSYLAHLILYSVYEKHLFYILYQIYESKIRKKAITMKSEYKISLDITQAWAVAEMLEGMDLDLFPYEYNIQRVIISEIDKQTV